MLTNNLQFIRNQKAFTMIELVMVILLIGILSTVAVVKWPSGMEEQAAVDEFKRAVRYAQHIAMTRQYTTFDAAWSIIVAGNQYTIRRADNSETATDPLDEAYPKKLVGDISITAGSVAFNALGEPINALDGALLGVTIFSIGTPPITVTIYPETGYVE
ncbi:MAG: type II secretion system GspH family protein [Proteobacteria bacterium]|nr:type II secretion system GspH family protein [Pseudomonadota bacterium]MBU1711064.1 type II secretion system GspH family protein [Pseudomonadota bacterium]